MFVFARENGSSVAVPVENICFATLVFEPVVHFDACRDAALPRLVLHPAHLRDRVVRVRMRFSRLVDTGNSDRHIFPLKRADSCFTVALERQVVIMRQQRDGRQHFFATGCI